MTRSVLVALTTSAFLLALATPGFSQTKPEAPPIPPAGVNGVTVPSCVYCPVPDYSEEGRNAKVQGTVVVQVVVTVDGRAERASVVRGLGSGLDEKAIEAVKKWRFKPAHDSDGHPVAVRVPMEVTFRIN